MVKKTIVSIYQVNGAGQTGLQVGEGSLVLPRSVLVHPPLSDQIATTGNPGELRVGISSKDGNRRLVEVIDGLGPARVLASTASTGALVGLELRTQANSPVDVMTGIFDPVNIMTGKLDPVNIITNNFKVDADKLVELVVPLLQSNATQGWNDFPDIPGIPDLPIIFGNIFCQMFRFGC